MFHYNYSAWYLMMPYFRKDKFIKVFPDWKVGNGYLSMIAEASEFIFPLHRS